VENSKVVFYVKSLFFVLNFSPSLFTPTVVFLSSRQKKKNGKIFLLVKRRKTTSVIQTTEKKRAGEEKLSQLEKRKTVFPFIVWLENS
jgi:hypothetical protein